MDEFAPKTPIQPDIHPVHPEAQSTKETGSSPPNLPTAPYIEPLSKKQHHREHCRPDQTPWWKYVIELAAILVGIAVAFIYYRQLGAMLDSNTINRELTYSIQRPFLFSHGITKKTKTAANPSGEKKTSFEFTTQWENAGSTPAVGVVGAFGVIIQPDELTEQEFIGTAFDKSVLKSATSMIGPKQPWGSSVAHQPEDFATDYLDIPRFFWGWLVYRDTFPSTKPHVTEFCWKSTKITRDDAGYSFDATVCAHHNCVDEFCEDYTEITSLMSGKN